MKAPVYRSYRAKAEEATRYLLDRLWDNRANLFHPSDPPAPKALPYDFMWGNGVAFSALVGGMRYDPARFRPLAERFFTGLDRHWDKDAPIPAYDAYFASPSGDDKYYDDNAWMVLTFAEAYDLTGDRRFLNRAVEAQRYVLSGWDEKLGGGIYWRQDRTSKNTCSNGPAAAASLALAKVNPRYHIGWAERIVGWTNAHLQDADGLFWDNINLSGKIEKTKWTYNTALMLRANLGLYRLTKQPAYLRDAQRLAQASRREFVNERTKAFRDDALFSHLLVEAFLDLYKETGEAYLLDTARQNAAFVYTQLRDARGGYFSRWDVVPNRNEERKTLIANASVARLFWLLTPYPDTDAGERPQTKAQA